MSAAGSRGPLAAPPKPVPRRSAAPPCLDRSLSIRLESIAGAADRLQIARKPRISLDLAAQTRHLHIDIANVAAQRQGKLLTRHGLPRLFSQAPEQPGFGGGQMDQI